MFRIKKICATPFLLRGRHQGSLKGLDISLCTSFSQAACEKSVSYSTPGVVGNILECYTLVRTPPLVWVTDGILWVWKSNGLSFCILTSPVSLWEFVSSLQICGAVSYTAASWLSLFMLMFHLICRKKKKKKEREAGEPRYKNLFEICTPVIFLGLSAPSRNPPGFEKRNKLQKQVHWRPWKFTASL